MLKSMTAYGRGSVDTSIGRFIVEIQSVNRRHLEINIFLPKELMRFEMELRKWIASAIGRGQITVKIDVNFGNVMPLKAKPNLPLVRQLKEAWAAIIAEIGLDPQKSFSLDLLANEPNIILYNEELQDEQLYLQQLQQAVDLALQQLLAMKIKEGEALNADIVSRIAIIKEAIETIEKKSPNATSKYREKLINRLEEFLPGNAENEEKILREVAIFAERVDIAEEVTRIKSHLNQLTDVINKKEESVGKTMEFVIQELNRETNTIGSKATDVEVSHFVVTIKSELERIREQIQNIE